MQPLPAFLIIAVLSIVTSGIWDLGLAQLPPTGGELFGGKNPKILPIREMDPSKCGQYECSRRKWKWGTGEMIPVCCDLVDGKCPKRTRENLLRCRELIISPSLSTLNV